jgi:hypothetical protein
MTLTQQKAPPRQASGTGPIVETPMANSTVTLPLVYSTMNSVHDLDPVQHAGFFSDIVGMVTSPKVATVKHELPLIKLATFGTIKTEKGSRRHDANVIKVSGLELDYDGGKVPLAEAAARLRAAGVEAVLYTTPSHRLEAPRWRALLPLSRPHSLDERRELVGKVNALLGGIIAPESFVPSQAFYIGCVADAEYAHAHSEGVCADLNLQVDEIDPVYPSGKAEVPAAPSERIALRVEDLPEVPADLAEWGVPREVEDRVRAIDEARDRSAELLGCADALYMLRLSDAQLAAILTRSEFAEAVYSERGYTTLAARLRWLCDHTLPRARARYRVPPAAEDFDPVEASPVQPVQPLAFVDIGQRQAEIVNGARRIAPRAEVYPGYMRGELSLTLSPGGTGKTQLQLTEAVCMALDEPLLGQPILEPDLRVLYVNMDDAQDEIDRRVRGLCLHHRIDPARLAGRFFTVGADAGPVLLAQRNDGARVVLVPEAWARLEGAIRETGADVLNIDPLANVTGAEEDNQTMLLVGDRLAALARVHNLAVNLTHHTRKAAPGQKGGVTAERGLDEGRGGSALPNRARLARTLRKMTKNEAGTMGIVPDDAGYYLSVTDGLKGNYAPVEARRWYRLYSVGLGNGEDRREEDRIGVPVPWTPPQGYAGAEDGKLRQLLDAIERGPGDGVRYTQHGGAKQRGMAALAETLGWTEDETQAAVRKAQGEGYLVKKKYVNPKARHAEQGLQVARWPAELSAVEYDDDSPF